MGTSISNVSSMVLHSHVKGMTHLTYVTDIARTRDLINTSKLSMMNRIFYRSHFIPNCFKGFEGGCNIIFVEDSGDLICYPLNVR